MVYTILVMCILNFILELLELENSFVVGISSLGLIKNNSVILID